MEGFSVLTTMRKHYLNSKFGFGSLRTWEHWINIYLYMYNTYTYWRKYQMQLAQWVTIIRGTFRHQTYPFGTGGHQKGL